VDQYLTLTTRVRIRRLAPGALRVTHAPASADSFPPDRPWLEHVLLGTSEANQGEDRLRAGASGGLLQVSDLSGDPVLTEARPPCLDRKGHIRLSLRLEVGESIYGLGEWFNAFRRQRGTVRLHARNVPSPLQAWQSYSAVPFFLSSRGYGFLLLNSYPSTWRLRPERGLLEIEADGPPADYVVLHGPSYKDILSTYTALTGRPPLPPRWAFGLWVTGYPQEHQNVVLERAAEHRQRGVPLDGVILDYHWEEAFHNFRWRPSLFPDPDGLITDLKKLGVRLGLILTPFLNSRNLKIQKAVLNLALKDIPPGLLGDDERALPEFEEARANGYLIHDRARWWFGEGGMLDFTNPAASAWWNERMRPRYEQGVAFFKNDDGEAVPSDARSAIGIDGRELHNLYGFYYGKALYEGMAALDDRRPFIYARSTWAGSQRYPALFLGDQNPTFECIRRTMRAGLNMGLAGFAYWTADVFGLDGKTTAETHMRYAQWALLAPVARYFWRPPQIDGTRFPWSHGPQAEANFRTVAELRYRLLPYYCALAWEAYRTGLPILRPLMLEFEGDPRLAGVWDQAMLGDRLMLAPVVERGATRRRIILPEGQWYDFWSSTCYEGGGEIEVAAPLDRLPILVRGGTILPLGPALTHIPDGHTFDRLELHLWPPYPAKTVLFDDDGASREYQRGVYTTTEIVAEEAPGGLSIRIGAAHGDFPGQPDCREFELVLHRSEAPSEVRIDGGGASGWEYEPAERLTRVHLRCPTRSSTVIEVLPSIRH
jgi:alpha-D-xyloside xylohydrolase